MDRLTGLRQEVARRFAKTARRAIDDYPPSELSDGELALQLESLLLDAVARAEDAEARLEAASSALGLASS